jgi:short-subunit dehydrogenase
LGAPTILINNAGIVHKKSILDTTAEEVEQYVLLDFRNLPG